MTESREPKQPTYHLPPRDEREPDDERTTDKSYPGENHDTPVDDSGVSEDTAAEPTKPARHGVAKLPPGPH
jgi:hypothetical protein